MRKVFCVRERNTEYRYMDREEWLRYFTPKGRGVVWRLGVQYKLVQGNS